MQTAKAKETKQNLAEMNNQTDFPKQFDKLNKENFEFSRSFSQSILEELDKLQLSSDAGWYFFFIWSDFFQLELIICDAFFWSIDERIDDLNRKLTTEQDKIKKFMDVHDKDQIKIKDLAKMCEELRVSLEQASNDLLNAEKEINRRAVVDEQQRLNSSFTKEKKKNMEDQIEQVIFLFFFSVFQNRMKCPEKVHFFQFTARWRQCTIECKCQKDSIRQTKNRTKIETN